MPYVVPVVTTELQGFRQNWRMPLSEWVSMLVPTSVPKCSFAFVLLHRHRWVTRSLRVARWKQLGYLDDTLKKTMSQMVALMPESTYHCTLTAMVHL